MEMCVRDDIDDRSHNNLGETNRQDVMEMWDLAKRKGNEDEIALIEYYYVINNSEFV
jgi:hypothetical protein